MAKMIYGIVSSKKTDKTIVVTEHVRQTHPLYRKQYTVTKRFMAHDENNEAQEGDKVVIVETRPISARKHFKLDRITEKAGVKHVESEKDVPEVLKKAAKPAKEEAAADTEASEEDK
ncbi:MAG TPA: 30S ribosomal protein S17 [Candidatus Saccharimonadales bacterium]